MIKPIKIPFHNQKLSSLHIHKLLTMENFDELPFRKGKFLMIAFIDSSLNESPINL